MDRVKKSLLGIILLFKMYFIDVFYIFVNVFRNTDECNVYEVLVRMRGIFDSWREVLLIILVYMIFFCFIIESI